MNRAVFLDRDGVLNVAPVKDGKPLSPRGVNELRIVDDAKLSIMALIEKGFKIVVVTNQPEISRGNLTWNSLQEMHQVLKSELRIEHFYVCPHDDIDNCSCRKPKPGMILRAAQELSIDTDLSYLVGDRWKDIEAGQRAGCQCVYIERGYREKKPTGVFITAKTLNDATNSIMGVCNK